MAQNVPPNLWKGVCMNDTIINIGRTSREQFQREQQRRLAVMESGYAFVVLRLIDRSKRRVSGIEELIPQRTRNQGEYKFTIESRQLSFYPDINTGAMTAHVLYDSEWNKRFLASHLSSGYWKIVSVISDGLKALSLKNVMKELYTLQGVLEKEEMADELVEKEIPQLRPPDKPIDIANLDIEILEQEIERRRKEQVIEVGARVPKKKEIDISNEELKKIVEEAAQEQEQSNEPSEGLTFPEPEKRIPRRGRKKKSEFVSEDSETPEINVDSIETPVVSSSIESELISNIGVRQP